MKKKLIWAISFTVVTAVYSSWLFLTWPQTQKPESHSTSSHAAVPSRPSAVATTPIPRGSPLPPYAYYIQRPWQTCDSVLEVRTLSGSAYVLKLVDHWSRRTVLSYYLPGGATREIEVPSGTYEIRYSSGTEWFGTEKLFGPSGRYAKAHGTFEFTPDSGYELTLYSVPHGNLGTTPIRPQDF